MSDNLFQEEKTGKLVEFLSTHDNEYAMVRDTNGKVSYARLAGLVPYDQTKGRLPRKESPILNVEVEEELPNRIVPLDDKRVNLNMATPEIIAKRLPGIGFTTAKKIIELRQSLSGEKFSNLKQLENIPRVNWDQLIKDDLIFIA